ncbi:F5/8 type C domain protein [Anaerohalosphaera lusitana]|uniref:F5/8 type C domain protein n=1 Tax=Anaerohalosphaera lusitana TaxID=1936003 RepID=A0A1U9NIR6_9BACT|nr:glycosyl hydrolase [Anaerohalosphaera lusitana]AQT67811.1 F5/8 type C domain protein [Anaerohalosphaera lusitana]
MNITSRTCCCFIIGLLFIVLSVSAFGSQADAVVKSDFVDPPIAARPGAFWPWLNGSFSLERITYELEEMKDKGMSGADIWDVKAHGDPDNMIPVGPEFLGPKSLKAIGHAVKEADRLGLHLGMLNSSGWNAGGTWTTPDIAGMGMFHSKITVEGPKQIDQILPFPEVPANCPKDENGKPVIHKEISVLAVPQNNNDMQIDSISNVVDLNEKMDANGKLTWDVPPGKWTIIRLVMTNTGYQLIVPSPNSRGPMIDFLNPQASRRHFDHIIDKLESEIGDLGNSPLKYLEVDSLELGHHTVWTYDMIEKFRKNYGYDPVPYLPLLKGFKLEDDDIAKRFKYDWKKHISDVFIESHYRTSSNFLNEHGLKLCAEAGGPGAPVWPTCPVDSLKALGSVDILRGEFWPKMHNIWLVKEISSAAHIYGKKVVDAESFTSWRHWTDGPYFHKQMADAAMIEGLNHFTFHTFTHSPEEAGLPGRAYHAGTHINPNVVWWPMARGFIDYLSRCSYMLQKGLFVADVCYYYGDQAPNFVSAKGVDYSLEAGYDYDVVNSDVILNRMSVKDGRIVLPDGMSYRMLVLPEREDMNLDVLRKIESLVKAGATVVGPKPTRSGSLVDYPNRDKQVAKLADEIWGDCDGTTKTEDSYGKGQVFWNRTPEQIMAERGIGKDFSFEGTDERTKLHYIHRRTEKEDIYFVVNKNERWESVECAFRVTSKQPEIWYPDSGEIREVANYHVNATVTSIPLHLKPAESVFIVFRRPAKRIYFTQVTPTDKTKTPLKPALDPHSATPAGAIWLSDGKGEIDDQFITFDLGSVQDVDKIRVWNYTERLRGFMNYGIKDFDVLASSDGKDFHNCGSFELKVAHSIEDKHYHQDIDVDIEEARYVRFNVKTNQNSKAYCGGFTRHAGLSKVRFFNGSSAVPGVTVQSVSSGRAFDPATDDDLGMAHPAAELLTDEKNSTFLRAWIPGTYVLKDNAGKSRKIDVDSIRPMIEVSGEWKVSFTPNWGAPEETTFDELISWTDSDDDGIKYYSGIAAYHKEIDIPEKYFSSGSHLELDLGVVQKTARVRLNGQEIAVLWKPPFTVDITDIAIPGKNKLVVEVANTWTNRLIGDAYLPPEKQFCETNLHSRMARKGRRLQPSGLIGPVRINAANDVFIKQD